MKKTLLTLAAAGMCAALTAQAKVDLVSLPDRKSVQLTIYNSADLTLVRDRRVLTFREGMNRLQFSWANTRIDPTSLDMEFGGADNGVEVRHISYPPRVKDAGIWHVHAEQAGEVPVEITYFTSGISWRSFYMATLGPDEKTMRLKGYVRVTNHSGEDYAGAQVRLVVGKINLLDRIAQLAQRTAPYGRPTGARPTRSPRRSGAVRKAKKQLAENAAVRQEAQTKPKEIKKEGLSEYFLYTIEGTETIRNGWSKRMPSFEAKNVDVENVYKYNEQRFNRNVVRFLRFRNDKEHNLGKTPLPGGRIKVYATVNEEKNLRYIGTDNSKYIPVDQKIELNLGTAAKVKVEPKVMDYRKDHILFDNDGDVNGFDEIRKYRLKLANYSGLPATLKITRNFSSQYWSLENHTNPGTYKKVDLDTVKYSVQLKPHTETPLEYTLTLQHGRRRR